MNAPFVLLDGFGTDEIRLFEEPERLILARTAEEAPAALRELDAAQAEGFFVAGSVAYELGYLLEPTLARFAPSEPETPYLALGVFRAPRRLSEAEMLARLDRGPARLVEPKPLWAFDDYRGRFETVRACIGRGDFYQANLTFPIEMRVEGDPLSLYPQFRSAQKAAYGGVVELGGPTAISFSPELFFELRGDQIRTRPMKGTAPRGVTPDEDAARRHWLNNDPKNLAENLMIVDLLRNDISRLCRVGTVEAPELFRVESYPTVHQMTSLVTGRLEGRPAPSDFLRALFPCGSITGAPKIKAMETLAELETGPRGVYCGAIGVFEPGGDARFNVAIRTLNVRADGRAAYHVGGGLVWDSTAEEEYQECLLKARFLINPPA